MSKTPTVTPSRKRPLSREPSPPKYQEDFAKVSLRHDISSLDSDYTMKDPALLRKLLLRIVPKMRAEENEVLSGELERTCDQAESMHEPTVINLGTEQGLLATMVRMSDAMVRALAISVIKLRRPDSKFAAPDGSQSAPAAMPMSVNRLGPATAGGSQAAEQSGGQWPSGGQCPAGSFHSWANPPQQAMYGGYSPAMYSAHGPPNGHPPYGRRLPAPYLAYGPTSVPPSSAQPMPLAHLAYGQPSGPSPPGLPSHLAYGQPAGPPLPLPAHTVPGGPSGHPPPGHHVPQVYGNGYPLTGHQMAAVQATYGPPCGTSLHGHDQVLAHSSGPQAPRHQLPSAPSASDETTPGQEHQ